MKTLFPRWRAVLRACVLLMGLLGLATTANAACATPTGTAGDMTYSTSANVMAYCDGTNWISMNGGVSLTVNTSGGVTPYGASGDVQINNGSGGLGGDTGNFKYSASTLSAPIISASTANITTLNSAAINNTGLGTFGSILDNGGLTVLGAASMTTISATAISGTIIQVGTGGGASCAAGINGAIRYNSTSGTIDICTGTAWTSLNSGTITGSGISGGSATAIAFWNGPSSLTYESATTSGLYWDHANGRLGVGTNTPSAALTISNSSALGVQIKAYGGGSQRMTAYVSNGVPYVYGFDDTLGQGTDFGLGGFGVGGSAIFIKQGAATTLTGINTTSPTATLQVSGTFIVSQTGQNTLASASLAVDSRGVSVSTILHMGGYAISPIGASGNVILSGTTAVSTSSAGSITMYAGGTQRMMIDTSGVYPGSRLWGAPTAGIDYFWIGNQGTATSTSRLAIGIEASDTTGLVKNIHFWTAGAERMSIDPSGNLFIGTTSSTPNPGFVFNPSGAMSIGTNASANGWAYMNFQRSGVSIGSISQNTATSVVYNTTSDRRVKENITDTREGLQKLMQIGVKDFSFRADASHTIVNGFIAQDLNKVYPEAVTTNGDNGEVPLKDKNKLWQVDYGRVTPLIVKAVQELNSKLEADNDNLRALLRAQQKEIDALSAANDNAERRLEKLEGQKTSR